LIGFIPVSVEPGIAVFQGTPGFQHYNPSGSVHGGYAATLLDTAVGCAIHSTLPAGKGFTTLELKVNYIRGLTDKVGAVRTAKSSPSADKWRLPRGALQMPTENSTHSPPLPA